MALPESVHKGIITRKLTEVGINADLDPLWDQQRPLCGSDDECAQRVYLAAIDGEIADLIILMREGKIESGIAYPLLAAYGRLQDSAKSAIAALPSGKPQTQVGYLNLGFSTRRDEY